MSTCDSTRNTCKPCQHQTARRNRYQHCHKGSVEGEVSTIACVIPWNVNMRFHLQNMQVMPASDSPSQSVSTLPQVAQWKEKSVQLLVSSLVMSTCDSTRNTCKPCQHQTARRNRYQHRHKGSVEGEVSTIACVIHWNVNMRFHPQHMQAMPASDSPSQSASTLPQGLSGRRRQYNCFCHPLDCQHAIPPATHASHASIRQPVAIGINTATRGSVEGEVSTIACVIPWNVNMRFHPQHMQAMPASDSPSQSVSTPPQRLSGRRSQYNCLCHHLEYQHAFPHNDPCKPSQHQTARRNRYQHRHKGSVEGEVSTIACVIPWNVNMRFHPQHCKSCQHQTARRNRYQHCHKGLSGRRRQYNCFCHPFGVSTCDPTRNTCKPCQHPTARHNRSKATVVIMKAYIYLYKSTIYPFII